MTLQMCENDNRPKHFETKVKQLPSGSGKMIRESWGHGRSGDFEWSFHEIFWGLQELDGEPQWSRHKRHKRIKSLYEPLVVLGLRWRRMIELKVWDEVGSIPYKLGGNVMMEGRGRPRKVKNYFEDFETWNIESNIIPSDSDLYIKWLGVG